MQVWFQNRRQKQRTKNNVSAQKREKPEPSHTAPESPTNESTSSERTSPASPTCEKEPERTKFKYNMYDLATREKVSGISAGTAADEMRRALQVVQNAALAKMPPPPPPLVCAPAMPVANQAYGNSLPAELATEVERALGKPLSSLEPGVLDRAMALALQAGLQSGQLQQAQMGVFGQMLPPSGGPAGLSLERPYSARAMNSRLALFSPTAAPQSPIDKKRWAPPLKAALKGGVPMNRRSISMDAIEVLAGGFGK